MFAEWDLDLWKIASLLDVLVLGVLTFSYLRDRESEQHELRVLRRELHTLEEVVSALEREQTYKREEAVRPKY